MKRVPTIIVIITASFLFVSALGVVWAKHRARVLFIQLQALNAERDRFNIEWSQLKLEQSAWATPGRVEQMARGDLRMTIPRAEEVKMVQP